MTAIRSVLYVEDDPSNRLVMRLLVEKSLQIEHYTIFEDSADFMARVRQLPEPPDLILLDIHVAPLNGFQMLRLLRADPHYARTRVVALTASVMNEEVEKLRQSGFDAAIGKPLSLSSFPGIIARIMQGESVWQV